MTAVKIEKRRLSNMRNIMRMTVAGGEYALHPAEGYEDIFKQNWRTTKLVDNKTGRTMTKIVERG